MSIVRNHFAHLKPYLTTSLTRTHSTLLHLSRLLSTTQGIEATLCTTAFTLTLLHSQLIRLLTRHYEKLALALANKASSQLLPGETVLATISPPETRLSTICAGVKSGADLLLDFWIFTRLWALVHVYKWAREVYAKPPRDAIIKTLVWGQVGANAVFQLLENLAYLASKGVLRGEKWERRWPTWMAVSNRFWMVQVLLEGLRLLRVRQLSWNEDLGAEKVDSQGNGEKEVKIQSEALKKRWKREFYANAGWFPLTLHWSYVDEARSPVSEVWQGICGLVPGVILFQDVWRETA